MLSASSAFRCGGWVDCKTSLGSQCVTSGGGIELPIDEFDRGPGRTSEITR